MKHCKVRKLPGWHRREAEFRDWYTGLLERIQLGNDAAYVCGARVLKCPRMSGYRECATRSRKRRFGY